MDGFMKNITFAISLLVLPAFLQGCLSQDTVGDTTQQQQNRENGIADSIDANLKKVKGVYVGTFNDSSMILTLDDPRAPSITGSSPGGLGLSPQPYLGGILQMEPPIFVETVTGKPMMVPFTVSNGQFVDGDDLSLTVTVNNAPTTAHCKVSNHNNDIACEWYVNASDAASAHFELHRLATGQSLVVDPHRTQGTYFGTSSVNHVITAIFETREDIQPGPNSIPVVTIGGSVTKDGRIYSFKGAQYDPINSTLVIPIGGTNNPEVNCSVISADKLRCDWFGRQGLPGTPDTGANEVFELTKAS